MPIKTNPEKYGESILILIEWRKGCGTILHKHAEKVLQERGYTQILLWVFAQNPRARLFYEAMGFKTDGESKMLNFGIPLEVIRYRKELKDASEYSSPSSRS